MWCGSDGGAPGNLIFERATDSSALSSFKCGVDIVDKIIQTELNDCLTTNDLYFVEDGKGKHRTKIYLCTVSFPGTGGKA